MQKLPLLSKGPTKIGALRNKYFVIVWSVLSILYLAPILLTDHLPMQDIPNHLAIIQTLSVEDSTPNWNQKFENRLALEPYITFYGAGVFLAKVFGTETANRIILALYGLLFPLSFVVFQTSLNKTRYWSGLFCFLLVYSDVYLLGFTNYMLCLPMVLFAAALVVRASGNTKNNMATTVVLSVLGILIYYTHPFGLILLVGIALMVSCFSTHHLKRMAHVAIVLAPAMILLALWLYDSHSQGKAFYLPLSFKLEYLLRTPFILLDNPDNLVLYLALGITLAMVITACFKWIKKGGSSLSVFLRAFKLEKTAWLAVIVFAIAYFAVPYGMGYTIWLDLRIAVIWWMMLFLAIGHKLTETRTGKILAVCLCLVSLFSVVRIHKDFSAEIKPLFSLIREMEKGKRVLPILIDPRSKVINPFYVRQGIIQFFSPYTHFGSYYHCNKGGISPWMTFYAGLDWIPLGLKNPLYKEAFRIADPFTPKRVLSILPRISPHFDYVLVRGYHSSVFDWIDQFANKKAQADHFTLFEVISKQL